MNPAKPKEEFMENLAMSDNPSLSLPCKILFRELLMSSMLEIMLYTPSSTKSGVTF